jgi:hypothetical protein
VVSLLAATELADKEVQGVVGHADVGVLLRFLSLLAIRRLAKFTTMYIEGVEVPR